jgi:hypothetical protein
VPRIRLSFATSQRMPGSCSVWSIAEICMIVGGAVFGRNVVEPVRRPAAPRARHVLRHEDRIARNMLGQMPRDGAGTEIVAAADVEADHQPRDEARRGAEQRAASSIRTSKLTSNCLRLPKSTDRAMTSMI